MASVVVVVIGRKNFKTGLSWEEDEEEREYALCHFSRASWTSPALSLLCAGFKRDF
jgi:hypothetical protein